MRLSPAPLVVFLGALGMLGCGAGVERATVLPHTANVQADVPGRRWAVDITRSKFDVVGVDVLGGRHAVTFDRWRAFVITGPVNKVTMEIDTTSARGESELVTRLLKYELLDVDHFPRAALSGTFAPASAGSDEQIVEGNATIHGVETGLRFKGTLKKEGDKYRFSATFKISRDLFGLHAKASWDGLIKDDVHIHVDALAREEHVTVEETDVVPLGEPAK